MIRRAAAAALWSMGVASVAVPMSAAAQDYSVRVARVLRATPLIDGHNDWPEALREREGEARWTMDLTDLSGKPVRYNTDIARLKKGLVGAQFWSVWVSPDLPGKEQVEQTLEQIDLVKSICARRYPRDFMMVRTAAEVRRAHAQKRIGCLIGVEGGGQIDGDLSVLRTYAELGAGYLTLTHSLTIDWADSATDNPKHNGLTDFGLKVVAELNRLGMLVDISHVSEATMRGALAASKAPVIFSHSSARTVDDHPRNVSDSVLALLRDNGGVVMVNFAPIYVSDAYRRWSADSAAEKTRLNAPPFGGLDIGQPDKAAADYATWLAAHPAPRVTLSQVADHIEHIAKVAGVDHVGLGSDYDGVGEVLPEGMTDVSTYPALLAELMRRGWSDKDIAKLAGGNVLRVMEAAERVRAELAR
ncbi:membrane dipeptidase [Sphingomonas gellani]|uniref:Membrane dipeptidase n=1 Tax=Sphingomonas gellani TaxID=1166340 RepID=A0A1H8ALV6_9SPHN|nr:dipeptidase [Sphingomonas gellani]SEM71752.1 membrane dipeptidase [Sphingomonas gellani]